MAEKNENHKEFLFQRVIKVNGDRDKAITEMSDLLDSYIYLNSFNQVSEFFEIKEVVNMPKNLVSQLLKKFPRKMSASSEKNLRLMCNRKTFELLFKKGEIGINEKKGAYHIDTGLKVLLFPREYRDIMDDFGIKNHLEEIKALIYTIGSINLNGKTY